MALPGLITVSSESEYVYTDACELYRPSVRPATYNASIPEDRILI